MMKSADAGAQVAGLEPYWGLQTHQTTLRSVADRIEQLPQEKMLLRVCRNSGLSTA